MGDRDSPGEAAKAGTRGVRIRQVVMMLAVVTAALVEHSTPEQLPYFGVAAMLFLAGPIARRVRDRRGGRADPPDGARADVRSGEPPRR